MSQTIIFSFNMSKDTRYWSANCAPNYNYKKQKTHFIDEDHKIGVVKHTSNYNTKKGNARLLLQIWKNYIDLKPNCKTRKGKSKMEMPMACYC